MSTDVAGAASSGHPQAPGRPPTRARTRTRPPAAMPAFVRELGGMVHLVYLILTRGLRGPYNWAPEFVSQFRFTVKVCFIPLTLTAFALSYGPAGVQSANFVKLFGATDRIGTFWPLIAVRLLAPMTVGVVLAGAAGTAICADLGARVVRQEIDALSVLGVDPVKNLVVPRVLALAVAGMLFPIFAMLAGVLGAILVMVQHGWPLGPFFANFFANAIPLELVAATVKCALFGVMIAVVCCYMGFAVSGGPEAVGRAVNRSLVVVFLVIGFTDYLFTSVLMAAFPELSQVRG